MTEYIQVDRDQLRVGMRFDYLNPGEFGQGKVIRRLTSVDPIEYDYWVDGGEVHHTDLRDHLLPIFWVHPDDLHVDESVDTSGDHIDEDGKVQYAEAFRSFVGTYDEGVRDGYLKAQQEQGAKPTAEAKRRDIRREDAVLWAVQALGGTPEAAHLLIPLAQQIERYVNGNDEQEAEKAKATDFPTVIETARGNMYITLNDYLPATVTRLGAE